MLIYSFTVQVQERISGLSEAVGDGPHLGDRLVDCSNEESMVMADLVRPLQSNITSFLLLFITDSERCL